MRAPVRPSSHADRRPVGTIRVVIADDHLILLHGLKELLEKEGHCTVVGEAGDGREAVRLIGRLRPDIAILDIAMPGLNGLDAARAAMKDSPRTKVILLTMHDESQYVIEALNAGVHGYLIKTQSAGDLLRAIREVSANRIYLSPRISKIVIDAYRCKNRPDSDPLTLREREVLQLVAEGKTTKEVAERLGIGIKTAESHRTRIMAKLEIRNTAGLVRYAVRRGLIDA
jgi:DNA-binding NarL/FixJ family response regulator